MFNIDEYNRLPSIEVANQTLHEQLDASGIALQRFILDLVPLFSNGESAGKYAVWLVHRHFSLHEGERMVQRDRRVTEPTTDTSPSIIADRWDGSGGELEHRYVSNPDDITPPPSATFMDEFRKIVDARKVSALGVCAAPCATDLEKIKQGYMFMESTIHEGRKQVLDLAPGDDLPPREEIFHTSWIPHLVTAQDYRGYTNCPSHCCPSGGGCRGIPCPPPPTLSVTKAI